MKMMCIGAAAAVLVATGLTSVEGETVTGHQLGAQNEHRTTSVHLLGQNNQVQSPAEERVVRQQPGPQNARPPQNWQRPNRSKLSPQNIPGAPYGGHRGSVGGDVDCVCDATYSVGDRVEATVDNPSGAPGILAGHLGTVVCGVSDLALPMFIEWDAWGDGNDNDQFCDCGDGSSSGSNSGWWVLCEEIAPIAESCAADLDADGSVGVTDLLELIGSWGPCP